MIHFREARIIAKERLVAHIADVKSIERAVIVDDIFGKVRVLCWARENASQGFEDQFTALMKETLGVYWSGLWVATGASRADAKIYDELWESSRQITPTLRWSERVRSRGFWTKPASDPAWTVGENYPPVVGFYSFKGGVGRTTSLASFAIQRARMGETIVVLDLDLDAPGIGKLLDSGSPESVEQFGVVDYLLESPMNSSLNLADYSHTCPGVSDRGRIIVFPAGRMDAEYLPMLARLDLEPRSKDAEHPLLRMLEQVRTELSPDWILLDCRAGLSEASGFALSGLAHLTVLLGTTSDQGWQGLQLVIQRLGARRVEDSLPQAECLLVQTMTPENAQTAELARASFAEQAASVFKEVYYAEDPLDADDDTFWYVRDMESEDAPHQPSVLSYSQRLAFIRSIRDVADTLVEDKEYVRLADRIASRFGKERE